MEASAVEHLGPSSSVAAGQGPEGKGMNGVPTDGAALDHCPLCGAPGVEGADGCNSLFQEVVGREFSRPELFQVHRLTVDAYSLQHPEHYMESPKSAVAHLAGMAWSLEGDGDPGVSVALSRFLDGSPALTRPEPDPAPGYRGTITIADIAQASDSTEHLRLVRSWALDVWACWATHHAQAREWVEQAKRGGRPGGARR